MIQTVQRLYSLRRIRGVFYGWWLVGISGFVMTVATVPFFHALGIWSVALESHFAWTRTQMFIAFVLSRIEGGIMGPLEGYLTDRLGARRMVLIGLLILGAGFLLFSRVENLWMFYASFMIMALGVGLGGWLPLMTVVNNWFIRQRSSAMGWASVLSRLGALALVPAIAWAVDPDADRLGWQTTALIIGAIILLSALLIPRFIRNRPEDYGQHPDGDEAPIPAPANPGQATPSSQEVEFTARQALRTPAFYCISFGHAFNSMLIVTITTHLAFMLTDQEISLPMAAWVVTAYTGMSMVFQVVGGYIGDRAPKNVVIFIFSAIQAGSVLIVTTNDSLAAAFAFAVAFGIGFGGRTPLTVAIRGDYFGRKAFASIMGLSMVPMNFCLLAAPLLTAIYHDARGSYVLPFNVLAGICFLGGVLFLLAKKPTLSSPLPTSSQRSDPARPSG